MRDEVEPFFVSRLFLEMPIRKLCLHSPLEEAES
jgi:hypothetical protein